jgi:PEP-CTERM motif-containing protein
MRAEAVGLFRAIATTALILIAAPAGAVDFSLAVYADGVRIDDGTVDQSRLGCVDNPDGVSAVCNAQDLNYGGTYTAVQIDIEDFFIDSDPIVTGTLGVTNTASTPTHFTFVFTLPVTSMPNTLTGGRISGTLTDQGGGGATVSTFAPNSFYTALIDGLPYGGGTTTLYDDPTAFNALNNSTVIPQLQFGTPIPSFPGPAVATSIGIQLDFVLTGFDHVSFTSNHVVVPEPGTAALLGLGLVFLARKRRVS